MYSPDLEFYRMKKEFNCRNFFVGTVVGIIVVVLSCPVSEKQSSETKCFTFVQICDTQLGYGGYQHDIKSFRQTVKQINLLKPDFVVICGDLVNEEDEQLQSFADFNKIKKELLVPCYCAVGNNDIGNVPTEATLQQYRKCIGEDYYSFEHKGYMFVIVNTQLWKSPLKSELKKHDLSDIKGIIFDIRENLGGNSYTGRALASHFIDSTITGRYKAKLSNYYLVK